MKMIVHGSTGRMGQNLIRALSKNHVLAAGVSVDQETNAAENKYHSLQSSPAKRI